MQRVVCLHQRSPVVSGIIAVDRDRTFWITEAIARYHQNTGLTTREAKLFRA